MRFDTVKQCLRADSNVLHDADPERQYEESGSERLHQRNGLCRLPDLEGNAVP